MSKEKFTCDRPDRPDRPFLKLRNFLRYRKKNLLATDPTDPPDRFWNSVIFEISKGNLLATDPTDPPDRFWNYVIFLSCRKKNLLANRPDRPARPFLKWRTFFEISKEKFTATDPTDPPDRFWNYVIFWDIERSEYSKFRNIRKVGPERSEIADSTQSGLRFGSNNTCWLYWAGSPEPSTFIPLHRTRFRV